MAVTELGQAQGMAWARSACSSFTGQPLAELQEWQGGKKAPAIPVSLEATTGKDWKSSYGRGEKLSLDGLTLTIVYDDGSRKSFKKPFDENFSFWPYEGWNIEKPTTLECIWRYDEYTLRTELQLSFTDPVLLDDLLVDGVRMEYGLGEQISLEGLVVKAQWQQPDGSIEEVPVQEQIGNVTDGYTMILDGKHFTSENLPAAFDDYGWHTLFIDYYEADKKIDLEWRNFQPAITKITRQTDSFSPGWPTQEILLTSLPVVTVTLDGGEVKDGVNIYNLVYLSSPRQLFVEARYEGLGHTVVVNASADNNTYRAKLNGIVDGHVINGYRYLYGSTQSTATPVSEWLSITGPTT